MVCGALLVLHRFRSVGRFVVRYAKGSQVIRMLQVVRGEAAFQASMQAYLRRFALGYDCIANCNECTSILVCVYANVACSCACVYTAYLSLSPTVATSVLLVVLLPFVRLLLSANWAVNTCMYAPVWLSLRSACLPLSQCVDHRGVLFFL
jgi:hypothetical protein